MTMSHENRQKVGGLTIIELYFVLGIWAYNWEGGWLTSGLVMVFDKSVVDTLYTPLLRATLFFSL